MNPSTNSGLGIIALATFSYLVPAWQEIDKREVQIAEHFASKECEIVEQSILGNGARYTFCEDGSARREQLSMLPFFTNASVTFDIDSLTYDNGDDNRLMSQHSKNMLCNVVLEGDVGIQSFLQHCKAS